MKKTLTAFYILVMLLCSCSTDFDVIAPYKEIIVVDGFLNARDSIQYVKISKAFLGEGNAYVMAKQSDSINYADVLDVKMQRIFNKQVAETFPLNRSELYTKDSGTFAYPFHVLYSTSHPILQNGSEYKIIVTNTLTGTEVTSKTKIVYDLEKISTPNINKDSLDLVSHYNDPSKVTFTYGANSRVFDLIIRFHYREIDPSGVSREDSVDWNFTDRNISGTDREIKFLFYKYDLFYIIGTNIPDKPGYIRRLDSLSNNKRTYEYIFIAGSDDLETYYKLHQPSTGIVQELPVFTTVENGLGIFTSRILHSEFFYAEDNIDLFLDTNIYMKTKNFEYP